MFMFEEKTFADAQQTSSDSLFENLASKLFQEAQPALPLEAKRDEPEAEPVIGTPIERLTRYMGADSNFSDKSHSFLRFDRDGSKQLSRAEISAAMEHTVNRDELLMLQWMGRNMDSLECLGDHTIGFGVEDLKVLQRAYDHGAGGWGMALRQVNWSLRAGLAFGASLAIDRLVVGGPRSLPYVVIQGLAMGAMGLLGTYHRYQREEQPGIENAIDALRNLPNSQSN